MPLMGITRLANITGLDRIGLPVFVAIRPNSRILATSQGKGETIDAAKASALMESIESWHGERVEGRIRIDSYESLMTRGFRVAEVMRLPPFSHQPIPLDRPFEWIEGEDLISGQACLVPFDAISTNYVECPGRRPVCLNTANGLASGNHLLEAIVHGLCEVIERDAITLWSLSGAADRKATQIDPATITSPLIRERLDAMARAGIRSALWNLTTDLGIPVFGCTVVEDPSAASWRPVPEFTGYGCHLDSTVALSRAVHEAIQCRTTLISGSRDDLFEDQYERGISREAHRLAIESMKSPPPTAVFPSLDLTTASSTLEGDLAFMLSRLKELGISQVIAVDLTRTEIGVSVVKIVVPGLEPYDARSRHRWFGERARSLLASGRAPSPSDVRSPSGAAA